MFKKVSPIFNGWDDNHKLLKNRPVSDITRAKLRAAKKGKAPSRSAIESRSKQMKEFAKTEAGKLFYKKLGKENSLRNAQIISGLATSNVKNSDVISYGNKIFKRGKYFSEELNKEFWYDSSWELSFIKYIESIYNRDSFSNFDRNKFIIPYIFEGRERNYVPDFFLELNNGCKVIIELKPERLVKSNQKVISKIIAAKKYFKKFKYKFIILTEKELFISKKEKYYSKKIRKKLKLKSSFNIYDYIV